MSSSFCLVCWRNDHVIFGSLEECTREFSLLEEGTLEFCR
jgi:hypothetical protein